MITTIIFDFGGVLAFSDVDSASKKFAKKYGINQKFLAKNLLFWADKNAGKKLDSRFFKKMDEMFGLKKAELKKAFMVVQQTGALKTAKALQKNFHIFLLSNQLDFKANFLKKNFDFSSFEDLFFSSEMGMRKPFKKIFVFVLKKIRKKPKECVFIDDTPANIKTAKSIGMRTILFKNTAQMNKKLMKMGVKF